MSIAFVQGKGSTSSTYNGGITLTLTDPVGLGNCLIATIAYSKNVGEDSSSRFPTISDDLGNIWSLACVSQFSASGGAGIGMVTYIATNCLAGSTTVSTGGGTSYAVTVDEYSGVADARAVDQVSFASTPWASGLQTIDSGNITITTAQTLYSAGYSDSAADTLTSSSGFTGRSQAFNTNGTAPSTLFSFDKAVSSGTHNSVIDSTTSDKSLQVILISLVGTPVATTLIQTACGANSSITGTDLSVAYPFDNTAGNLLIAVAFMYERTTATLSDTQGNTWVAPYSGIPGQTTNIIMGYALNCKAGPNTVNVSTSGGGTDTAFMMILAEYYLVGAEFTTSSYGKVALTPSDSVSTGFISVVGVPQLLVSGMVDGVNCDAPIVTTPGTRKFQASIGGFFQSQHETIALADQIVITPGDYDDTFIISPTTSDQMEAAIMGFIGGSTPPPPPAGTSVRSTCGNMPSLEVTRDLDCDWTDSSTFYITQDTPMPFTLRALVLRMSYNQD